MKVILLQDVKNLGKKGDVVDVADGYGQNFLLPRRLAATATEGAMKAKKREDDAHKARLKREKEQAQELARKLEQTEVTLAVRAGEGGKLFGSVTSKDVAAAIVKQTGITVEKKNIQLSGPIKSLGKHSVTLKLYPKVSANLTLDIVAGE